KDPRFITIFAPENKNVVHAYQRGFKAAYDDGFDFMIEMDGGLSHNPLDLPSFVEALYHGQECVFGSRNIPGGSNTESPLSRRFLSKSGTMLANIFLGTKLKDMTSGFIGFRRHIVEKFIQYPWQSIAHFYHSEIRYLLRHTQHIEIPIRYRAPSPRVQLRFITNAFRVLGFYTLHRVLRKDIYL
ncbi:MAG TPA: glycosyltransferase, partial [Gammaproteobacteria bacterium]|nr:glycosyltransferase [Gammaproteobacteria bacterium]